MNPEDLAAAIKAFQERKAARMGGGHGDNDPPAEPTVTPSAPAAVGGENKDNDDPVQMVKDRRDRRDSEGDPETLENAMGVIAEMDEDIGTLLDALEASQAKQDFDETAATQDPQTDEGDDPSKTDGDDCGSAGAINADAADKIIRERIELVRLGDRLHLDGIESMSVLDAQKAIIRAVNPGMRLDGKNATYIKAAFDLAKDTMNTRKDTNFQRNQMVNGGGARRADGATVPNAKKARENMIARQQNGGNK